MANVKQGIAVELENILIGFSEEVRAEYDLELERICSEAAKRLKAESPKSSARGKHYANGWTWKKEGRHDSPTFVVYNKTKPGIAHLLEKGHAKVNGGRVEAIVHIKPVEDWAKKEAESAAETIIQRARG